MIDPTMIDINNIPKIKLKDVIEGDILRLDFFSDIGGSTGMMKDCIIKEVCNISSAINENIILELIYPNHLDISNFYILDANINFNDVKWISSKEAYVLYLVYPSPMRVKLDEKIVNLNSLS